MSETLGFSDVIDANVAFRATRDEIGRVRERLGGLRIYVGKLGQDGHDRGQHVVCEGLRAMGFDTIRGPLFTTAEELVENALEANAHVIGISSLAAGHMQALEVLEILRHKGLSDMPVVVGGVMPKDDAEFLRQQGVTAVFLPGTNILAEIAPKMKMIIEQSIPRLLGLSRSNNAATWHDYYKKREISPA